MTKRAIYRLIAMIAVCCVCCVSCVSEPRPAVIYSLPYVVLKSTWAYCYDLCGKKDQLAAVSQKGCICSNGGTIPFQPDVQDNKPASEADKKQIGDSVIEYLKGK